MADGSIEFSVELDAKDAERELSRLKKEINKLEDDTSVKNAARDRLSAQLKEIEEAYKKAIAAGDDETAKAMVKDYDSVAGKLATINEQLEVNADKLRVAKERAAEYARQLADSPAVPEPEPGGGGGGVTPERTSRAGAALAQRSKNFASQWKRVHSYLANSVGRLRIFSTLTAGIGKTLKRIAGLAGGAFIFSAISQNFRSLRSSMEEMLQTNTNLMMALTRFKGALKTAFLPIYEVAVPALTALLNLLTRILGTVAAFTAALTGKSAQEIKATAAALDQEADATEGVGKAAKDANKPLASFDEINKLSSKDAGGGAGTDTSGLSDVEFPEVELKSWGEMLDGFFDKLLGKLSLLDEAFAKFADSLNGFARKVLDAFTFPGLEDKVRALGAGLAASFNRLVAEIDWYTLGAALGAGLNLALAFLVEQIYGFDWIALGTALAQRFNGLVSQVNWYDFGRLLWAGFKIALELLTGFLLGLDMAQLAKAASQIAIGFFDSITQTLKTIDWQEIGRQVARFIANVDWSGVAIACFTAMGAAFGAAVATLWGFIQEAWKSVVQWWYDAAFEDGHFTIEGLLLGIWDAMNNIAQWIWEHIFKPFIDGFCAAFGIHSPSTVMYELGVYIIEGLLNGIVETWQKIAAFFSKSLADLRQWFADTWQQVRSNAVASWEAIRTALTAAWRTLQSTATSVWTAVRTFFAQTWETIKSNATTAWNGIKAALSAAWDALRQLATATWNSLKQTISTAWEAIKTNTTTAWNNIKSALTTAWNTIKQLATTTWNSLKQTISSAWEAIKTNTTNVWGAIKSSLSVTWNSIRTAAVTAFNGLRDGVVEAWQSLWGGVKGVLNSMLGGVESWINGIIRGINNMLSAISSVASAVGGVMGFGPVSLSLGEVRLPRLAQGAVIPPNREFLAVLGDQNSGTNIETPLATMVEAFRQALGESGAGQRTLVLKIGEREFGRTIVDLYNQETTRVGVTV